MEASEPPTEPHAVECFVYKLVQNARGRGGARCFLWNAVPDLEHIHQVLQGGNYGEGVFRLELRDANRRILRVERYAVGADTQPRRRGLRRIPAPTYDPPALVRPLPATKRVAGK